MLACLIDGCVLPEAELSRLVLWAIVVGVGFGVMCSAILSKALDLALLVVERRYRIEDARHRDHAAVPSMHWRGDK
ncbi:MULTISPECIES: hypothetical protein [Bacteria]|jgi:hypothetical protein|uniref:hypothetical protein n=1 Tax=Bacteria TaxID=2 RepID=UPI000F7F211F|nr:MULTISPECIES: hypothetical protein [Bacteria]RSZ40956.1 hypothetical protein EJO70_13740 [Variovorax sp. 553]RSZ42135.1 hypothetical protein EJO71_15300 [Variovorax sp. 679]